jgi:uncharacterized protein YeaO (DUF488 family)
VIGTKRIYEARDSQDGTRVLVMRLWPRGIRKEAVDLWNKERKAELANLKAYKAGTIGWPQMKRRYLAGLGRPETQAALDQVQSLARRGTVTLLCACEDERRCHRSLLAQALARPQRKAAPPTPRKRPPADRRGRPPSRGSSRFLPETARPPRSAPGEAVTAPAPRRCEAGAQGDSEGRDEERRQEPEPSVEAGGGDPAEVRADIAPDRARARSPTRPAAVPAPPPRPVAR